MANVPNLSGAPVEIKREIVDYMNLSTDLKALGLVPDQLSTLARNRFYRKLGLSAMNGADRFQNMIRHIAQNEQYLQLVEEVRVILPGRLDFSLSEKIFDSLHYLLSKIPDGVLRRFDYNPVHSQLEPLVIYNRQHQKNICNFNLTGLSPFSDPGSPHLKDYENRFSEFYFDEMCPSRISGFLNGLVNPTSIKKLKFRSCSEARDETQHSIGNNWPAVLGMLNMEQLTHLTFCQVPLSNTEDLLLDRFHSLTHLVMDDCSDIGLCLSNYVGPTSLKHLWFRTGATERSDSRTFDDITQLVTRCQGLVSFALVTYEEVRISDRTLNNLVAAIEGHKDTLECLIVKDAGYMDDSHTLRPGEVRDNDTSCLHAVAKKCRKITHLEIPFPAKTLVSDFTALLATLPRLEALSVALKLDVSSVVTYETQREKIMMENTEPFIAHAIKSNAKLLLLAWTAVFYTMPRDCFLRLIQTERNVPGVNTQQLAQEYVKYELPAFEDFMVPVFNQD